MQFMEFYAVNHTTGQVLPNATVAVFETGTTTLATVYDIDNVAMANPFEATNTGLVGFAAADGVYDLQITSGEYSAPPILKMQLLDGAEISIQLALIATAGLITVAKSTRAVLYADLAHDAGTFALVYADPVIAYDGVYVKTGASGAGAWSLTPYPYAFAAAAVQSQVDAATAQAGIATTQAGIATTKAGEAATSAAGAAGAATTAVNTIIAGSTKTQPDSQQDLVIDDLERIIETTKKAGGVKGFGALNVNSFQGVDKKRLNEAISSSLRNARYRGRPVFPFDINIVLISGQSNSEDADSYSILTRTTTPGVIMMDAVRPRHFSGTRGVNGFVPAIGAEYKSTSGAVAYWGGDMAVNVGKTIMKMVELENRSTFAQHGKYVMPIHIGQSSSSVAEFSYGTAVFTIVMDQMNLILAETQRVGSPYFGMSVGIIGLLWAWGADGYEDNIGKTQWKSDLLGYFGPGGTIATHLLPIFGQSGVVPVGIFQTAAQGPRNKEPPDPLPPVGYNYAIRDPYGAEAENELAETYDWIDIVTAEGPLFYNGADVPFGKGWAGSGVHHSAREAVKMGAHGGRWVKRRCIDLEPWGSYIPTIVRTSATRITLTYSDLPSGFKLWPIPTGLFPLTMQTNLGFMAYDIAAPDTALTLSNTMIVGNQVILDAAANWPASLGLKYGSSPPSAIAGALRVVPDIPEYYDYVEMGSTTNLETYFQAPPIFNRVVPA
jgi:hypothetical protein